jgi:hypothetical protein
MALGIDITGVEDVDPFLTLAEGPRAAAEAAMVSLLHAPGTLWWAPDRGYDLRQHLNSFASPERVQRAVLSQVEQGERVESAQCSVTVLGNEMQIEVSLILTEDGGAVQFTLTINELGEVLNASVAS